MLLLVLADGDEVGVHDEDVRRHEDGVGEKAVRRVQSVRELVLVAVAPLQKPHRTQAGQVPRQFLHFGHVALAVEDRLRRIHPARQIVERHVARACAERRAVAHRRHRMEIGDEHEHLVVALVLEVDHGLHRAEVVAPMELARRLDARQNFHVAYYTILRFQGEGVSGQSIRPGTTQDGNFPAARPLSGEFAPYRAVRAEHVRDVFCARGVSRVQVAQNRHSNNNQAQNKQTAD